ncbi:MAG TPA: hypothetical protein VIS73_06650 [Rhodocyclaceae bacterium]
MRHAPKLLPWLARRAGVSNELAHRLWRRAIQEAAAIAGSDHSAEYHAVAIDRLLNLLEVESNGAANFETSTSAWRWRHPQRMARCAAVAAISITRIWSQLATDLSRRRAIPAR